MDFSDNDHFLQLSFQLVDRDNNILDAEDVFVVWDMFDPRFVYDLEETKDVYWPTWSLPSALNCRYLNRKLNRFTEGHEAKLFAEEQNTMTAISRFSLLKNAVIGSLKGELFVFRFDALTLDDQVRETFEYQRVPKRAMAISKANDACTSKIESLKIFQNRIVCVTGNNDQCILQYRVEYNEQDWELDFNFFLPDVSDPFGEIPNYPKFMALYSEVWS